jgi:hypothetical protein
MFWAHLSPIIRWPTVTVANGTFFICKSTVGGPATVDLEVLGLLMMGYKWARNMYRCGNVIK